MSPINRNLLGLPVDTRLAGYAALAGAALAAPAIPNADAAIIYSGPVSISVPNTTAGVYLNFVTNISNVNPASVPGWDFNPFGSGGNLAMFSSATAGHVTNYIGVGATVSALNFGDSISAASTYGTTGTQTTTGAGAPFRTTQSTAYVGVQFQNEANANLLTYGWVLLSTTATTGFPATIIGYAYESSGAAITAGAIPEPSTFALLGVVAAGAVGLRAWRKRKAD